MQHCKLMVPRLTHHSNPDFHGKGAPALKLVSDALNCRGDLFIDQYSSSFSFIPTETPFFVFYAAAKQRLPRLSGAF